MQTQSSICTKSNKGPPHIISCCVHCPLIIPILHRDSINSHSASYQGIHSCIAYMQAIAACQEDPLAYLLDIQGNTASLFSPSVHQP